MFRCVERNNRIHVKGDALDAFTAFLVWSLFAFPWWDKGCDIAEAYTAVFKYGAPEGLEPLPACYG
ncbi:MULTISPECIES: hypothetical protein [Streptomyces]|uniref:Uncharacterized protein n=1 Tax=Streptomyces fimbriatus TaxID=68197 RepID=A0ABW0D4N3_STRFI